MPRHVRSIICVIALGLAGCSTTSTSSPQPGSPFLKTQANGSGRMPVQAAQARPEIPIDQQSDVARASFWGARYQADPTDPHTALQFAEALQATGSTAEALAVLKRGAEIHPNDAAILSAYGKSLTRVGKPREAISYLALAHTLRPSDWSILSAQGVAYDIMGETAQARLKYEAALERSPGNPHVLNNLALSLAQAGDLDGAESALEEAARAPKPPQAVAYNLALVDELRGRSPRATPGPAATSLDATPRVDAASDGVPTAAPEPQAEPQAEPMAVPQAEPVTLPVTGKAPAVATVTAMIDEDVAIDVLPPVTKPVPAPVSAPAPAAAAIAKPDIAPPAATQAVTKAPSPTVTAAVAPKASAPVASAGAAAKAASPWGFEVSTRPAAASVALPAATSAP